MTEITHEALEALSKKATQGEAMTNPRQALEEAFKVVFPEPEKYLRACRTPGVSDEHLSQLSSDRLCWSAKSLRFRRFLDAEAWESAAFMLVPERNCLAMVRHLWDGENRAGHAVLNMYVPCGEEADGKMWVADFTAVADNPALALAQACLKARENSDG